MQIGYHPVIHPRHLQEIKVNPPDVAVPRHYIFALGPAFLSWPRCVSVIRQHVVEQYHTVSVCVSLGILKIFHDLLMSVHAVNEYHIKLLGVGVKELITCHPVGASSLRVHTDLDICMNLAETTVVRASDLEIGFCGFDFYHFRYNIVVAEW